MVLECKMMYLSTVLLIAGLSFGECLSRQRRSTAPKELYLGTFVPFLYNDRFGYKAAIDLAVEMINNRSDILPGYKLVPYYGETYGQSSLALETLYRFLFSPPTKIALLGPAYSSATTPVADASTIWALIQITYAALVPKLVDKGSYPFFFRSTPSMISFNKAKVRFLNQFKWKRVALMYDYTSTLYFETVDTLQKNLKESNIDIISIEGFSSGFGQTAEQQIKKLKRLDARIIFGEFSIDGARRVFCEAYRNKMYGDKYVWMILGSLPSDWTYLVRNYNVCTPEQLQIASNGYLTVTRSDFRSDNSATDSGLTVETYKAEIEKRKKDAPSYASFAFDAVWIVAKALDRVSKFFPLENFVYKNFTLAGQMAAVVQDVSFEAVSGPLKFSDDGERLGEVLIKQNRNGELISVAHHRTVDDQLSFYDKQESLLWDGKPPPLDKAIIIYLPQTYPVGLLAALWTGALLGIIFAVFLLVLNIKYRSNRLIKMSSPNINNVIIIGCILCFLSVLITGLDTRLLSQQNLPFACTAFTWIIVIGFTLSFGALFSKSWRVHRIFTAAKSMEKVAILDRHLFSIIFLMLIVDLLVLGTWIVLSPWTLTVKELTKEDDVARDVVNIPLLYQCTCKYQSHFTAGVYAYKGILLIFGLFLAWETRHVEVMALNDSKYIGMAVYNVCALSALGVICVTALSNTAMYSASYIVTGLCIIMSTLVTLGLVFIPKVRLLFTKTGKTDIDRMTSTKKTSNTKQAKRDYQSRDEKKKTSNPRPDPLGKMEESSERRTSRAWSSGTDVTRISFSEDVIGTSFNRRISTSEIGPPIAEDVVASDPCSKCYINNGINLEYYDVNKNKNGALSSPPQSTTEVGILQSI